MKDKPDKRPSRALDLTAVICTHGRQVLLRRAVQSLVLQDPAPAEILIVENAPDSDHVRRMLKQAFPQVKYTKEPVLGLNFARNHAIRRSSSEVVAFLDDDAEACTGWAAALSSTFDGDRRVGVCTGRVTARSLETEGQRLFEANGGYDRGPARICLPEDSQRRLHGRRAPLIAWAISVGNGTSYAIRRSVAIELGEFDEALDLGAVLPAGGDHDMLWRVLQAGYRVIYEPTSQARHEHRRDTNEVYAQIANQQRGFVAMLTKTVMHCRGRMRFSTLAFLCWRLIKPGVRLVRCSFGHDPLPARMLIGIWAQCWAGLWAYRAGARTAELRRLKTR